MERVGCIFNVIMQIYWHGRLTGDPRTDDYALKKEKDRSKRQAPVTRGVHARIQKIFRLGGGSYPPYPTNRIGQVSDKEVRGIS